MEEQQPQPIQFDQKDKENFTFDPLKKDEAPSLTKEIVKQGTTRNMLIANILLFIFCVVFFAIAAIIFKLYVLDVV
jgi:hypothetical protein